MWEPDNFGWGSLFLFFQWISGSFVPILFLRQLATSKKGITVRGRRIHIFDAKVLNFVEFPEIIHSFYINEIHILTSIFLSINGATRILNLNLILMVLNLFFCKILCIYLCLSISVLKRCHIVINILFWLLASSLLFLNCSDNLNLTVFTKCVLTKCMKLYCNVLKAGKKSCNYDSRDYSNAFMGNLLVIVQISKWQN